MLRRQKTEAQVLEGQDLDGVVPNVYHRRWKILATMCVCLLLVAIGNSSLNLALPTLARELQLTSLQLTWMVEIYSLIFASLLFVASSVADRYGRKLIMQIGLGIFTVATLYAGFIAGSAVEIIITRAVMGIGGAMVMPTTLSIIENVFPRRERARAIAIWSGVAGGGIALGSVITGFLIEHFSWHSVFLFSAAVGIIVYAISHFLTPDSRDERQTPVDWLSGLLSVVGLSGLVYGIIEAPTQGLFHSTVSASLIVGLGAIGLFVRRQLKLEHPMLDMKLFKIPAFSISALSITLVFFALLGIFFSLSQLFQLIIGYSAIESSLRTLPIMMLMMLTAPFVPNIVKKFGIRWTVTTGLVLVTVSFLLMSQWPTVPSYAQIIGSMLVMMTGMALTMTPATNMLMSAIPRNRAGMGSAMNDTTRQLGGALGIAVLGSVLSSGYTNKIASSISTLPGQAQELAGNSLAGALAVAGQLGSPGVVLADAAKAAWMGGLSNAVLIAAVIVAAAAVITGIWLPHSHHENEDDEILKPVIEA